MSVAEEPAVIGESGGELKAEERSEELPERGVRQAVALAQGLKARCLLVRQVTFWLYLPYLPLPSLQVLKVPLSRQLALQCSPYCCCPCLWCLLSLTALGQLRPQRVPGCL